MVSIVIPVYNRYPLVVKMVDSIINQTYKEWELILVDDGSTDGTFEKLQTYVDSFKNISLTKRLTGAKGAPSCRNAGLHKAQGEYIIFFDSDDIIAPYCLEQRVHFLDTNTHLNAGVFPARHFQKSIEEKNGLLNGVPIYKDDLAAFYNSSLPYIVWNVIFRKDVLVEHNIIWDEQLLSLQDADFNIQCILKGLKIGYALDAKIDYYARSENNNSISAAIFKPSRFDSHIYFVRKQFTSLSDDQIKKYKKHLYFRLVYTFMLMSHNYSNPHVNKLLEIAKEFNCNYLVFRLSISLNRFFSSNMKFKQSIANALTFCSFVAMKKKNASIRSAYHNSHFA